MNKKHCTCAQMPVLVKDGKCTECGFPYRGKKYKKVGKGYIPIE